MTDAALTFLGNLVEGRIVDIDEGCDQGMVADAFVGGYKGKIFKELAIDSELSLNRIIDLLVAVCRTQLASLATMWLLVGLRMMCRYAM